MVVRVMEANVALRLAGGVADRHGKAGGGATTSAGGGRWRCWGMMRTRRRAGIGGETETKAKGGPGEEEEVYKWLRERDQGAEEGDQRSHSLQSSHWRLLKIGTMESLSTHAPTWPSPGKCKLPFQELPLPTHRPFLGNYPIFLRSRYPPSPVRCHSPSFPGVHTPAQLMSLLMSCLRFRSCPSLSPAGTFCRSGSSGSSSALLPSPFGLFPRDNRLRLSHSLSPKLTWVQSYQH